jgi:hypothetical protein
MLSEFDMKLTVFLHFSLVEGGATIAGAFQFSNKQGLRVGSSNEEKCLARRLRSEARVKSGEEHDVADQTHMMEPSTQRNLRKSDSRKRPSSP